jgi:hypothetical protein
MGSSFTEFRGCGFWSRDPALEVWLYLLAREVERAPNAPDWLCTARDHWHEQATIGFNGHVSASLNKHLTTEERVKLTLELSERVLVWLDSQASLSADVLNSFGVGGLDSSFSEDVPADRFAQIGRAFVELLGGKLCTTAATSPVLPR